MSVLTSLKPVLESGDRLTREEFHRRYCARPNIWTELVEGVVYVASPTRASLHGEPHASVIGWLTIYRAKRPGVHLYDNATVRLDARNEVQPDACLCRYEPGGPRVSTDASYDLHDKKEAYRRNGVREYVVWRVVDGAIDWFRLRAREYVRVEPDERGLIESEVFPGLRLDVARMLDGDVAGVLAALG